MERRALPRYGSSGSGISPSQIVGLSLSGRGLPAGSHLRIRIGSRPGSAGARRAPGCEHSDDRGDAESAHIRLVDHDHGAGDRKAQHRGHGALESEPFPLSSFRAVASTTADATGHYSFKVAPSLNTTYHVVAKTSPPATSPDAIVKVRVSIGLHVSTSTPAIGKAVSCSGFVLPAYNGKTVQIQRKTRTGWKTVAQATLMAATPVGAVAVEAQQAPDNPQQRHLSRPIQSCRRRPHREHQSHPQADRAPLSGDPAQQLG